jgi:hypothetical protein
MNGSRPTCYNILVLRKLIRWIMTANEIREHIVTQPFRPFWIHVADGRRIAVRARDFILISPQGRQVDVYQPDDAHDILDIFHITGVSFDPMPPAPAANGQAQPSNA